jgi:hypothetical protein
MIMKYFYDVLGRITGMNDPNDDNGYTYYSPGQMITIGIRRLSIGAPATIMTVWDGKLMELAIPEKTAIA